MAFFGARDILNFEKDPKPLDEADVNVAVTNLNHLT